MTPDLPSAAEDLLTEVPLAPVDDAAPEEPAPEEPSVEEPAVDESAVDESVVEEPAVEAPAAEGPASVEELVAEDEDEPTADVPVVVPARDVPPVEILSAEAPEAETTEGEAAEVEDPRRFLPLFDDAVDHLISAAVEGDLGAVVPACPDWTLRDLLVHQGSVHEWARHAIVHAEEGPEDESGPTERAALLGWAAARARALREALHEVDLDAPVWHFGEPPHRAAFWLRRQAHETTVHAVDALTAVGRRPWDLPAWFAADGVDEIVTMFLPRQVRLGRRAPAPFSLRLTADDVPGWSTTLVGEGDETLEVRARSAQALYLALWGRTSPAVAVVDLDPRVAELLTSGLTP